MPSTLNPDELIIRALVDKLKESSFKVMLGYSAAGLSELEPPAILVQLDSMKETDRQNKRAKYTLELTVSSVTRTDSDTTYNLMNMVHVIRSLLNESGSIHSGIRKINFSDTQFDIAPSNGQLSFADMSVNINAVF